MTAYQYIYTSWREFGYQVYARSPQIPETEFPFIFRNIKYTAPTGLPDTSDPAEIDRLYPLAFASFAVNGKTCIARTRYLGQDDSGRYGNYFCHMLMFPQAPGFYATDLFGSPLWRDCLTAEEKQADRGPHDLPPLEAVTPSTLLGRDALARFIDEVGEDAAIGFISAFLHARAAKQRMVIWDTPERLPKWFALLLNAFPTGTPISFSTYAMDYLQSPLDIIGVPPEGCSFNYAMEQANRRMVVMDMANHICTQGIAPGKYAEFIITTLQYAPDNLDIFFRFLTELGNPVAWEQYDALCRSYLYLNGGMPLSGEALCQQLQEAQTLAQPRLNQQLAAHVMDALDEEFDPRPPEPVLHFLLDNERERDAQVFGYMQEHLLRQLQDGASDVPMRLLQTWLPASSASRLPLARYLADDYCLDQLADAMDDAQASPACRLNAMAFALHVAALSGMPEQLQHAFTVARRLLAGLSEPPGDIPTRLRALEGNPKLYAAALTVLAESGRFPLPLLMQVLDSTAGKESAWRLTLEQQLSASSGTALMALQLIYATCPQPRERRERFWPLYQRHAATPIAQQLIADYLHHIPTEQAFAEALDMLQRFPAGSLPGALLPSITRMLDTGALELMRKKHSKAVQAHIATLQAQGIPLPEGNLRVFAYLAALESAMATTCSPSELLAGFDCSLACLSKSDYAVLLDALVPKLAPRLCEAADLFALLQRLAHPRYNEMLQDAYIDELRKLLRKPRANAPAAACPLIASACQSDHPLLRPMEKELVACYSKLSEDELHALSLSAAQRTGVPSGSIDLVRKSIQKRENSLGNKLKNLFARK